MNDAHTAKRERIRKLLIAATSLGLSAAVHHAAAQTSRPTASPPEVIPPSQPTSAPPKVVNAPAAPAPRPAASQPR